MTYLGLQVDNLTSLDGLNTAREISQQPALWLKIFNLIKTNKNELQEFLNKAKNVDKVILTGAGTSAFIGESLKGSYYRNFHANSEAVSTTHLVSHPHDYLSKNESVLLISFARSGNSPESKAVVSLLDELCKDCYHLIITCNPDGHLANYQSKGEKYIIQLPSEANDKSLAMTSSYTGMLLAALLVARLEEIEVLKEQIISICVYAETILEKYLYTLKEIAELPFKRAVFLGSGPLYGTAMEGHLKLQELTDGNIICKNDSFLGFRHGPKAVVDNETILFYSLSNINYVSRYEKDLIFSMDKGKKAMTQVVIAESHLELPVDYQIILSENGKNVDEDFLTLPAIIPYQIISFFKSINEGLAPDNPSQSGAISRVVEGVNIYSLDKS